MFELKLITKFLNEKKNVDFVFFRGPTTLVLFCMFLRMYKIPFGVELNGIFPYRVRKGRFLEADFYYRFCDAYFTKNARLIVAVTNELAMLARTETKPSTSIVVAPNGVDADVFSSAKSYIPANAGSQSISLCFIGKLYAERGLETSLHVVKKLIDEGFNATLTIIGDGPLRNLLEKCAFKLGISGNVTFIGAIDPHKISQYVAGCAFGLALFPKSKILALTGGSPLKVWTYMALEIPVILSDTGNMKQYENIPGVFYVGSDDSEFVANYIIDNWKKYGKKGLYHYGTEGRRYVLENVSWERHALIIGDNIMKICN